MRICNPTAFRQELLKGVKLRKGNKLELSEIPEMRAAPPPHVHFGVRKNGTMVDPETYLNNPC